MVRSALLPGTNPGPARAIVNHVDSIGAMVRFIRDDGRIMVAPIGFWSSRFAEGARVTVFSEHGSYRGNLLPMVQWGVSRDRGVETVPMDWDHIELRLDEAVFDADDVRALGIEVGNFIALDSTPEVLPNGYIVGRSIDNSGCCGVGNLATCRRSGLATGSRYLHVIHHHRNHRHRYQQCRAAGCQ
ncbi:MAG: hypothetical protein R3F37_05175 [Candidatus Competibacteraceae bacterium]